MRQKLTAQCVDSILRHTSVPFELIIVDQGSPEPTVAWLKSLEAAHGNVQVTYNEGNVGISRGRNQGAKRSSAPFVVFTDNDVLVTEGWLRALVAVAEADATIAACGPKILSPRGNVLVHSRCTSAVYRDGRVVEIGLEQNRQFQSADAEVNVEEDVPWYPMTCILIRRAALLAVGGFDEAFIVGDEDVDLALAFQKSGYRLRYVPSATVEHGSFKAGADTEGYSKIRLNVRHLVKSRRHVQSKWDCKVFHKVHRSYLRGLGMSDRHIDIKKKFDMLCTVVEA